MSTKQPKSMMFLTVPVRICPTLRSSIDFVSLFNSTISKASLTSLPGLIISAIKSVRVSLPIPVSLINVSLLNKDNLFSLTSLLSFKISMLHCLIIFLAKSYDSGWIDVESSGSLPPVTLKKPAHCSNAFFPNLGTFNKSFLDLNGPFSSLYLKSYFEFFLHRKLPSELYLYSLHSKASANVR